MSYIKKYLQDAKSFANERYNNMVGFNPYEAFNDSPNVDFYAADGSGVAGGVPAPMPPTANPRTSQPYIITVSNASATSVSNFDVLGAYQYLGTGTFTSGSLVSGQITVSSAISNITYQEFLYQSMNSPFSVGLTYVEVISGSNTQVNQTLTLNTRDANGNQALKTLVPTTDPYQFQSNIVALNQLYDIDGFTKITIATILPSVVFRIQFYPKANLNIARGLRGNQVAADFGSPMQQVTPLLTK